jgi:hypothetical protein
MSTTNPVDESVKEAAMQIIHGGLFKSQGAISLPTVDEVAEIIERCTKATRFRQALVSLKRSLDPHCSLPNKYELLRTDWDNLPIFDASCEVCGKGGPLYTVFRVNPVGQQGVWRCSEHLTTEQQQAIDPEVKDIVGIIDPSTL